MANILRFLNLGAGGDPKTFVSTTLPGGNGQLGGVYEDNSMNAFQMFQLVDAALVANAVAYVKSYDGSFTATGVIANSSQNEVAGAVTATCAANSYTLLQQRGVRTMKYDATTATGGTEVIGIAQAAAAGTGLLGVPSTISVYLKIRAL